jgi:general secretion pathway protein C
MIKRTLKILNLACITLAVFFGVNAFYKAVTAPLLLTAGSAEKASGRASVAEKDGTVHPFSHYQPTVSRNLFKSITASSQKKQEPAAKPLDLETLKPTSLSLRLWGTVTGDKEKAYAVIEEGKTREQNLYRIGDSVETATVKMILREKVVLTVSGKDEILEMEDLSAGPRQPPRTAALSPSEMVPPALQQDPEKQSVALKRTQIEESLQNVGELMTQIMIRPHIQNGRPEGLFLSGIKPNSIFRSMGWRNGDIILGVDGKEIQTVEDALKLYENMRSSSEVSLQIKRRGRLQTIDYKID